MPILASAQVVEADALQLPINFVTEPEYPIVPVSTQLPQDSGTAVALDTGTSDSPSISTFVVVNGQYYSSAGGLLVPITGTATNTVVVSTAMTGFYYSRLDSWSVATSSTTTASTSTCTSTGGIYINGTSFWINSTPGKPLTDEQRARIRRRNEIRAHAERRKAKGSIKRAIKTMLNLGFEEEARIFLRGDTVEVSHPESLLKFVISKRPNSLFSRTLSPGYSTPYELSVHTKSDVFVTRLCVYMDKTPILDQVMALALFIKSGSEETILSKANWYSRTSDKELREILALEYPYLIPKLR